MARKRYNTEEIIRHLRTIEIDTSKGATIEAACRKIGVSEVTYHRGKRETRSTGEKRLLALLLEPKREH